MQERPGLSNLRPASWTRPLEDLDLVSVTFGLSQGHPFGHATFADALRGRDGRRPP